MLALGVASVSEAAGPLPPVDLSAPALIGDGDDAGCGGFFAQLGIAGLDVASNARGDTIVSWTRNAAPGQQMVQAAFRPAGGSFGPAQDIGLTDPCHLLGLDGATPDVALDAQGGAVIVFRSDTDAARAAIMPPGGTFGAPVDLATNVQTLEKVPRVAMNASGTAVAVWSKRVGTNAVIQSSTRQPGGPFGAASTLSAAGQNAKDPRVAVNDAGAAAVAWARSDGTVDRTQARVRPAGQSAFAPVRDLSTGGSAGQHADDPDVALDPAGVATVAWSRVLNGTRIQSRFLTAAGGLSGLVDEVSENTDRSTAPSLAVDASGTAVVVFRACPATGGGACGVKAAARPSGGSFGAVEPISAPSDEFVLPQVVIDPAGTATAAFVPLTEETQTLITRRPPGGSFGAVRPVSPPGGTSRFAALAGDDEGNVVIGWAFAPAPSGDNPWTAQVSAFDAAAPTLRDVTAPSSATPGQPIGFSAAATDRWSPATLGWSFGDGTSTPGGAATHAFGSVGAFAATVTATDAVGNVSSDTRSILVTPAAAPARKVIRSKVRVTWGVRGKRIFLLRLRVTNVPKGGKAELRCARRKSRKCPFGRTSSKKRRRGAITLFKEIRASKAVGKKRRTFRAGQRLQVRVTAKGFVGKVVRYDLKKGKIPNGRDLCLPERAKKPRERC